MNNPMLTRLSVVCGAPDTPNPKAFAEEFVKLVGTWSDSVLDEATDSVLKTRTYRGWPTPGECRMACEHAAKRQARIAAAEEARKRQSQREESHHEYREPTPEQVAAHEKLMEEFRRSMPSHALNQPRVPDNWRDVSRPAFEKMQRESKNWHMHLTPESAERVRLAILRGDV